MASGTVTLGTWTWDYGDFVAYQQIILKWTQVQNPGNNTNTINWTLMFSSRKGSTSGSGTPKGYTRGVRSYTLKIGTNSSSTSIYKSSSSVTAYNGYVLKKGSTVLQANADGTCNLYVYITADVGGGSKSVTSATNALDPMGTGSNLAVSVVNKPYMGYPNIIRVYQKTRSTNNTTITISYPDGTTVTETKTNNYLWNIPWTPKVISLTPETDYYEATITVKFGSETVTTQTPTYVYQYTKSGKGIYVRNGDQPAVQIGGQYDLPDDDSQAYFNAAGYFYTPVSGSKTDSTWAVGDKLADFIIEEGESSGFKYSYWASGFIEYRRTFNGSAKPSTSYRIGGGNNTAGMNNTTGVTTFPFETINTPWESGTTTKDHWGSPGGFRLNGREEINGQKTGGRWQMYAIGKTTTDYPWELNTLYVGFK